MLLFIITVAASSFLILSASDSSGFPPPLSAAKERELFLKMKEGDSAARDTLIIHNQRLVAHIVRKYYGASGCTDDLISIGTIGLIKGIDSFNVKNGARFATYAGKCIQNEILMYFRSSKKLSQEVSINETIDIDKDGNPLTFMDIIKIDDTVCDTLDKKEKTKRAIYFIDNMLNKREAEIMRLRYGLCNKQALTQREVAEKLNISRSYVSRIEKAVLERIKEYLE